MVQDIVKQIKKALKKAESYLINSQNSDGSWSKNPREEVKGPEFYQSPIILTSQGIRSLILLKLKDNTPINKAIFYLFSKELDDTNLVDLFAAQINGIKFSNADIIKKKQNEILNIIINKQNKDGFWPSFPKSSNLTNYTTVSAIKDLPCNQSLSRMREWLINNKAKDGTGWGLNQESEKTQVSFTANSILSLIYCGEPQSSTHIKKAIGFLKSKQTTDGGWPSSDLTYPVNPTTYGTALVLLSLIACEENPLNEQINKGIQFLLDIQLSDGGWPLKKGDASQNYTTCYAIKVLVQYLYILTEFEKPDIKELIELTNVSTPAITRYLFHKLRTELKENYQTAYKNVLVERAIATTENAADRRFHILSILDQKGALDTAQIIDELKANPEFRHLHKRSHLAQIKNDMSSMEKLGLIEENHRKYYLVVKIK